MTSWFGLDGIPIEALPIDDRGLQYGDGLFETIAIRNGAPRLWQCHIDRLARGCHLIGIDLPAESELRDGVLQAIAASDVLPAYAVAKIIMTAGVGLRGYGRANVESPRLLIGVFASSPPPIARYEQGVDVELCNTRLASNSAFAGIKTLNRLEQVLARSEIKSTGAYEGLTMDVDDNIICGTMSNVFFVQKNKLSTAPVDRCGVAGVMRRHVIETLQQQQVETVFRYTHRSNFADLDEVFLSNSQFGIMPVRRCGDHSWPVGEFTRNLMLTMAASGIGECRV